MKDKEWVTILILTLVVTCGVTYYLTKPSISDGEPYIKTDIGHRNNKYEANITFATTEIVSNRLGYKRVFFTDIRIFTETTDNFGELLNKSIALGPVFLIDAGNYYVPPGTYQMYNTFTINGTHVFISGEK